MNAAIKLQMVEKNTSDSIPDSLAGSSKTRAKEREREREREEKEKKNKREEGTVNFPREIFSAFVQHFVRIFAEFCTVLRENRSPFAKKWDKGDRWIRIGRGEGGGEKKKGKKKGKKKKVPSRGVTHV